MDLAAYRVVQEALTNVLRHAGVANAEVRVDYRADEVTVEVTDEGAGVPAAPERLRPTTRAATVWPGCGSGSRRWAGG